MRALIDQHLIELLADRREQADAVLKEVELLLASDLIGGGLIEAFLAHDRDFLLETGVEERGLAVEHLWVVGVKVRVVPQARLDGLAAGRFDLGAIRGNMG